MNPQDDIAVDPYATSFQQDPFSTYDEIRAATPVFKVPGHDWYMVTSMDLIRAALLDPATFSNQVTAGRRSDPPPEIAAQVRAIRAQGLEYHNALNLSDPPQHTRYRRLINRAFAPRALAAMDALVADVAAELADRLVDGTRIDVIDVITRPLPVFAILRILGLDDARRDDISVWSESANAGLGSSLSHERWLETEQHNLAFQLLIAAELDERRLRPRADLLTALVQAEPGDAPLDNAHLVWLVRELIVAGNETTTRFMAELIMRFDRQPGIWKGMDDDPAIIANLIEEGLRMATPAMGMFRVLRRDVVFGGVPLTAGTTVFLAYGAGNRDPSEFADPHTFDGERANARDHIAFGHGIHVCVGASLARMESRAILTALARRVESLRVAEDATRTYLPSFVLHGLVDLPVTVALRG